MEEQEKICRLCLKDCQNRFTVLEENATEFVGFLLENNLSVNEGALICAICAKSIKDYSNFKSTCLDVEDFKLQYINHKDSDTKLDLKEAIGILENHDICRLCMGSLRIYSITSLDSKDRDVMLDKIMLEKCLPELDLDVTEKHAICVPCRESLHHYFGFITNCLFVEEKIRKYCEAAGIDDTSLIKLKDVLGFPTEQVIVKVDEIKVEDNFCLDEHVDEEKCSKDLLCTSENVLSKKDFQEVKFKLEETFLEEIDCKIELKSENLRELEQEQFENVDDREHLNRFEVGCVPPQPEVATGLHRKQECLKSSLVGDFSLKPHSKMTLTNRNVTVTIMYKCDFCPFRANDKGCLETHLLLHKDPSEIEMYKCDSCLYQTEHKGNLKKHCLKHKDPSEVTMYKCDFCLYQTRHERYLKIHRLKHKDPSEVTMYKCDLCVFQTRYRGNLNKHCLKHKDPSEMEMYQCDFCLYRTKLKKNLERHYVFKHKDPSEVTMYKCDSCLYQTKRKGNLKIHCLKHKNPSEVTMYKCDFCMFRTRHKRNLRLHSLMHKDPLGIEMYQCDFCSYRTKIKNLLKNHYVFKHKVLQK